MKSVIEVVKYLTLVASAFYFISCTTVEKEMDSKKENTINEIKNIIKNNKGTFAVAYKDLVSGEMILINDQESFHAASTMKTPVMLEVFHQLEKSGFSLEDSIPVKNEFTSIVDGSKFSIDVSDDSDKEIYKLIGKKATFRNLIYNMITVSSNLATNILIEKFGAKNVNNYMRELGANKIQVLRGVEDGKAYEAGLNNTTTAYDLMIIFEHIAGKKILSLKSHEEMLRILFDQKFNDIIPAKLPIGTKIAHKTGSITNVVHDSGIVYLADGRYYVLVLLSKDLQNNKSGTEILARISETIYNSLYVNN